MCKLQSRTCDHFYTGQTVCNFSNQLADINPNKKTAFGHFYCTKSVGSNENTILSHLAPRGKKVHTFRQ